MQRRDRYQVRVTRVLDGDTVSVIVLNNDSFRIPIRVRLAFIDAPELTQDYGRDSAEFLRQLTRNKSLLMIVTKGQDRYGRVVGILSEGDGPSINRQMVSAGWAYYYIYDDGRDGRVERAEEEARARGGGMWASGDPGARPWEYRREQDRDREEPPTYSGPHPKQSQGSGCLVGLVVMAGLMLLASLAFMCG